MVLVIPRHAATQDRAAADDVKIICCFAVVPLQKLEWRLPPVKVAIVDNIPGRPGLARVIQAKCPGELPAAAFDQLQIGGGLD